MVLGSPPGQSPHSGGQHPVDARGQSRDRLTVTVWCGLARPESSSKMINTTKKSFRLLKGHTMFMILFKAICTTDKFSHDTLYKSTYIKWFSTFFKEILYPAYFNSFIQLSSTYCKAEYAYQCHEANLKLMQPMKHLCNTFGYMVNYAVFCHMS